MKLPACFVLIAAFAVAVPARAQLGDPNSMGNLLKDLHRTPTVVEQKPAQVTAKRPPRTGTKVLALSLRGLHDKPWLVPSISSVHGFVVDERRSDVILIARAGGRESLDWRDFAEALRAARNGGEAPYCSLDPNPANMAGEQRLRVGGVRPSSHFGKVMADADYLMKRTTAGLVPSPGLASFADRLTAYFTEDCSRLTNAPPMLNRFWFTPAEPAAGDVLGSGSGKTVWVKSRMSLLTDESFATQAGLVSRGRANPIAAAYARDFSARLTDLSTRSDFALFRRLHGLFQWVYVSNLIVKAGDQPGTALLLSHWADKVGAIEPLQSRYMGIVRDVDLSRCGSGYTAALRGGVQIAPRLPSSPPVSLDVGAFELAVLEAVDAAPNEVSWELTSGLPASFFAE